MGCFSSHPENKSAIDQGVFDIPLLNKPRVQTADDFASSSYFPMDSYTQGSNPIKRKPSYEGGIIEHNNFSVFTEPDNEYLKKQKFNECFSRIEVSTFQNVPIMSVQSHIMVPSMEHQQTNATDIQDYYRFMDQVIKTIIVPLNEMSINDRRSLVISE